MLSTSESHDGSPQPWTVQQTGVAKAQAYVERKDCHFIIRVPETQKSQRKSI